MSAPERLVSDSDVSWYANDWMQHTHNGPCPHIRDLAIDLKNERRYSKELETQLELMTHHRNRLLDKRGGHADV